MGVGSNQVDQTAPKELLAGGERTISKVAEETSRGDLNDRAAIHESFEPFGVFGKGTVSLRMSHDGGDLQKRELVKDRPRGCRRLPGRELEEEIASPIEKRQGSPIPPFHQFQGVGGKQVFTPREHRRPAAEQGVQFED